jgi:uncharacterized OB-fold protein
MSNPTVSKPPAPLPNADSRAFWEGAAREELLLRHCTACGKLHYPPRHLCPHCWSDKLDWTPSAGKGMVYSFTVMHRAPTPDFVGNVPYVVALVDLEEGPRMMANIVGDDALATEVGDRVSVCYEARPGASKVPQFQRAKP